MTENATIAKAYLGFEDHGILTAMLEFDFGGTVQGFGGYGFDHQPTDVWIPSANCALFIRRILDTVGVSAWHELVGRHVRARRGGGTITAIGHIVKDQWFTPSEELK